MKANKGMLGIEERVPTWVKKKSEQKGGNKERGRRAASGVL